MRPRVVVGVITGLASLGCCPIPMSREYVTVPGVTFQTEPGAEVLLVRRMHPHTDPARLDVRRAVAGPDGRVTFAEERRTETVMPLMMHGVHEYSWTWCASAPGDRAASGGVRADEIVVTFDQTGRCVVLYDEVVVQAAPGP